MSDDVVVVVVIAVIAVLEVEVLVEFITVLEAETAKKVADLSVGNRVVLNRAESDEGGFGQAKTVEVNVVERAGEGTTTLDNMPALMFG